MTVARERSHGNWFADETPTRQAYLARICAGGFPEVQGVSRVQHVAELPKLLGALAAMTGQQLVVARLAEKVALARQTVDRTYLPLLETVFMAVRLPAWSRNLLSRVTRHPKSYVADSGVATHLLRVDERAWRTRCVRRRGRSWRPSS